MLVFSLKQVKRQPGLHFVNVGVVNKARIKFSSSRGVIWKRYSKNMQQTYSRTPMAKCHFNKVDLQLYWNHALVWVFSCKIAAYFLNIQAWTNFQVWTNCGPEGDGARLGAQNLWDVSDFTGVPFCLVKNKKTELQIYSWIGKKNEKFTVNSKYFYEHRRNCNILVSIHLMASKLLYLLKDWEIFN